MARESNKKRRASNEQTARARAAQMRLEQQRKERRQRLVSISVAVVAVLAVAGVIIAVGIHSNSKPVSTTGLNTPLPASVVNDIKGVTPATLSAVGTSTSNLIASGLPAKTTGDAALTSDNKPDVLYIGAEFCPFCAAERWPLAVALSRFGTLSGLETMHSSPKDVYPNTPTMSFRDATYTSKYLSFTPVENQDINHNPLQNPTKAQEILWTKYSYTCDSGPCGDGYPFIDIAGKTVISGGSSYLPSVLSGLSQEQVGADLNDPSSKVAQAIDASANYITAALCQATGDQPATVCRGTAITLPAHFVTAPTPGASIIASATPTAVDTASSS